MKTPLESFTEQPSATFTELDTTLKDIKSLLLGALASFACFPPQHAEVHLLHMAKDCAEKAEKQVESLYNAYLKTIAGHAPLAEDEQE